MRLYLRSPNHVILRQVIVLVDDDGNEIEGIHHAFVMGDGTTIMVERTQTFEDVLVIHVTDDGAMPGELGFVGPQIPEVPERCAGPPRSGIRQLEWEED